MEGITRKQVWGLKKFVQVNEGLFLRSIYLILQVDSNTLFLEKFDDLRVTLPCSPIDSIVPVLQNTMFRCKYCFNLM